VRKYMTIVEVISTILLTSACAGFATSSAQMCTAQTFNYPTQAALSHTECQNTNHAK